MNIASALRYAAERLAEVSDTARLDAELLMAHALGVSRSELLLRHMGDTAPPAFALLAARRERHEPVAYIVGKQEFFGREFRVTAGVLIPRADSETLIEVALAACPAPERVLDCGVGTGALLLTILAERSGAEGLGIDNSPAALAVAEDNAACLGLAARAAMLPRDWCKAGWREGLGQFDLILANPPYVEEGADLSPSIRSHEPAGALFAGPEGLDDYRMLVPQLSLLLSENGIAVVEIGAAQADAVTQIAEASGFSVELHKDLALHPRALVLRFLLGKNDSAS